MKFKKVNRLLCVILSFVLVVQLVPAVFIHADENIFEKLSKEETYLIKESSNNEDDLSGFVYYLLTKKSNIQTKKRIDYNTFSHLFNSKSFDKYIENKQEFLYGIYLDIYQVYDKNLKVTEESHIGEIIDGSFGFKGPTKIGIGGVKEFTKKEFNILVNDGNNEFFSRTYFSDKDKTKDIEISEKNYNKRLLEGDFDFYIEITYDMEKIGKEDKFDTFIKRISYYGPDDTMINRSLSIAMTSFLDIKDFEKELKKKQEKEEKNPENNPPNPETPADENKESDGKGKGTEPEIKEPWQGEIFTWDDSKKKQRFVIDSSFEDIYKNKEALEREFEEKVRELGSEFGYTDDLGNFIPMDKDGNILSYIPGHFDKNGNFVPDNEDAIYDNKGIKHPNENIVDGSKDKLGKDGEVLTERTNQNNLIKILEDGTKILPDGTIIKPDGSKVLPDGTVILSDGTKILSDGTKILPDGSKVLQDGTRILPDGTVIDKDGNVINKGENGITTLPDGSKLMPDGTIIKPDGTKVLLGGTIVKEKLGKDVILDDGTTIGKDKIKTLPDGTKVLPDGTVVDKDGNVISPNDKGIVNLKDSSKVLPDGTVIKPDGTKILPDGTVIMPDGTKVLPDGTKILPDGTKILPDGTVIKPDGTVLDKNGNVISKDEKTGITKLPNGDTLMPDGTIVSPNLIKELPDGTKIMPNGIKILPDGTKVLPDGTRILPDGTVIDKDGNVLNPDENGIITLPDGTKIMPDGTVIMPDGTTIDKNNTITNPDGSKVLPDGTVVMPDGTVVTKDGKVHVPNEHGFVEGITGDTITKEKDSSIKNKMDKEGYFLEDGTKIIYGKDKIGKFDENGNFISNDGTVYDNDGGVIKNGKKGYYDKDGSFIEGENPDKQGFYDKEGNYHEKGDTGYFDKEGKYHKDTEDKKEMHYNEKGELVEGRNPYTNGHFNKEGKFSVDEKPSKSFYDKDGNIIKGKVEGGFYDKHGNFHKDGEDGFYTKNGSKVLPDGTVGYYDENGKFNLGTNPNKYGHFDSDGNFYRKGENGYYTPEGTFVGEDGKIGYYDKNGVFHEGERNPYKEGYFDKEGNFYPFGKNGFFDRDGNWHEFNEYNSMFDASSKDYIAYPGFFRNPDEKRRLRRGGKTLQFTLNKTDINPKFQETMIFVSNASMLEYDEVKTVLMSIAGKTASYFVSDKGGISAVFDKKLITINRENLIPVSMLQDLFKNTNIGLTVQKSRVGGKYTFEEMIENGEKITIKKDKKVFSLKKPIIIRENKSLISLNDLSLLMEDFDVYQRNDSITFSYKGIDGFDQVSKISLKMEDNFAYISPGNERKVDMGVSPQKVIVDGKETYYVPISISRTVIGRDMYFSPNKKQIVILDKDKSLIKDQAEPNKSIF